MKVKRKKNPESLPRHLFKQTQIGFFPLHNHLRIFPCSRSIIYYLLDRFIQQDILEKSDKTAKSNISPLS